MHHLLRLIASSLFAIWVIQASPAMGQLNTKEVPLETVLAKVGSIVPKRICGWERGSVTGGTVVVEPIELSNAVQKQDFDAIVRIIVEQTGYECIMDDNCFVVVPKARGASGEEPLVMRQVTYPAATDVPLDQFLGSIEGANANEGFWRLMPPMTTPIGVKGPIAVSGGQEQ